MQSFLRCTAAWILAAAVLGAAEAPSLPKFIKKPAVTREGEKVKIEFAVSRETDVAVYVENAKGEIVRHLVAGVLGKNPPDPLKAGSLEQSVVWDGKDDDGKQVFGGPPAAPKPIGEGEFKVRVGLGLKASWGGLAFADPANSGPNRIESVIGLAAGSDGRVYVLTGCDGWLYWKGSKMHVFRRDGSYERTIKPFPSNLPVERVKATGAFMNSFGRINPISHNILGLTFYPQEDARQQPAVTPDGRIVLATVGGESGFVSMIDTEGGTPEAAYSGPALKGAGWTLFPSFALAPDGKAVFISGMGPYNCYEYKISKPWHAIYRAKLPERGPTEVFFGEAEMAGSDNAHLNDPRGLAMDGQGHLLIADFGNNRVVVLDAANKSVAGSFLVPSPNWMSVHPKTGAVYVQSGEAIVKFSGWKEPKELARLKLPPRASDSSMFRWSLALDASAEPPVLWIGRNASTPALLRCEDRGAAFSDPAPVGVPAEMFWRPASDPTRRWVACMIHGGYGGPLKILDESTGQTRQINNWRDLVRLGPDGNLYPCTHYGGVYRCDASGKEKPFPATAGDVMLKGHLPAGSTGTTAWDRDWYVDRKSDIYVRKRGPQYHGLMTVEVYDQEGRHKRTVIWTVSDGMYGPRVDPKGNIYIMEAVKASGRPLPEEFSGRLPKSAEQGYDWIYGSIVKFGPEGGAVWFSGDQPSPLSYEGWTVAAIRDLIKIKDLKTTGGCLTGTIVGKNGAVSIPVSSLDAATVNKFSFRLKNSSGGTKAALWYSVAGGDQKVKTTDIKPNSDFAEYTIDLSGEAAWKGNAYRLSFAPADDAATGTFALDWFRSGEGGKALEWKFDAEDGPDKKLPATMKKESVYAQRRPDSALQGALWYRPGFSPVGDMAGMGACHCTGSDFDVDDFGRVFAPDTGRFRVGVLDTNGNEMLSFGGYGNQDFCGPESYVLDPAGKYYRPRKDDDPKDLKSPFAEPEIGLAWIVGLAVTDRYAYVDDVINKRILRVKLDYATVESVRIP